MTLSDDSKRRYARHMVLPEIGAAGQEKLLASSALIIGAGGLGSAAIAYLAAAGVGRLGIIEPDRVELSNLQRQVLFEEADIGRPKAQAALERVEEVNPGIAVEIFQERLTAENAASRVAGFDIVLDCSDNFDTRFTLGDACWKAGKPLVSAALSGFEAQLSTFKPGGPCYRCFVPEKPEREIACAQEGVIGPLAGVMGSLQALEAIKELLGIGESLSGRVLLMDALTMQVRCVNLPKDSQCSVCSK